MVASGIVSVFRGIWPDFWGPRLEYILYAAVAAVLNYENVSLMGVSRMLSDEGYRAWVVKQVKDPMVRRFWTHEFARYDKKVSSWRRWPPSRTRWASSSWRRSLGTSSGR